MEFIFGHIQDIVFTALNNLVNPASRVYWLYLLTAAIAAVIFLLLVRQYKIKQIVSAFANKDYWLHRSSRQDISIMLMNIAIKSFIIIPLFASHLAATIFFAKFFLASFGDAPDFTLSKTEIALLFTLVFFISEDFSRYALHRLMHAVPILWRLHKVHHSAEVLTPFTLFRAHPIEMCLYYCRGLFVFGVVSGAFIYLFQGKVSGYEVLGIDILGFLFNLLFANLRHSHIPLSFGVLEKIFISPVQHQIHHSSAPEHHDKNFGSWLAIWDRLGGTWLSGRIKKPLYFGLQDN